MYVARWPESTGHDGWGHASRIARCVTDNNDGTFRLENLHSGRVGEAQQDATREKAVVQCEWDDRDSQRWILKPPL